MTIKEASRITPAIEITLYAVPENKAVSELIDKELLFTRPKY